MRREWTPEDLIASCTLVDAVVGERATPAAAGEALGGRRSLGRACRSCGRACGWCGPAAAVADRLRPTHVESLRSSTLQALGCPVSDWKVNYEAQQYNRNRKADKGEHLMGSPAGVAGEVVVDDGDDNGVIDTWSLSLSGCPLEHVPSEGESWRIPSVLPEHLPISGWVSPRQRGYWRSKMRGHHLPQPKG